MKTGAVVSCVVALAVCGFVGAASAAVSVESVATTNRTVSVNMPVKVTSDMAQFFYDQGAVEFIGNVHLHKVDYRFDGNVATAEVARAKSEVRYLSSVRSDRTDLDLFADRVTIFLDQDQLDRSANRKSVAKKATKEEDSKKAAGTPGANRRQQLDMLTSVVADGAVFVTNRTVSCTQAAAEGTALALSAVAGAMPTLPAVAAEKQLQTCKSAKIVYFSDSSKLVLYGDEKAPACVHDSDSKADLEGGKITCWLDLSPADPAADGTGPRKSAMGMKLKQAVVEKSTVILQSGGSGLGGVMGGK